ncbi:MAG: tRNA (N(6)-L-threonylcarbamoyladenosine(37)-C(2))-methylthiotransferase MtaB [Clostridia bacterium]|nr:tRNA (N(6)-L-threonylcarbamoyladenosine(37)-C(2))-methylthiotransferase MtaB [Clostridia bacterium]
MKIAFYTLGCKVNQYESEALLELLEQEGFSAAEKNADVCVINTCTVTAESDKKSKKTVRRAIRENPGAYVLVTGCASQIDKQAFSSINGVSFVNGNRDKKTLARHILHYKNTREKTCGSCLFDLSTKGYEALSVSRSERTRAYMKIEDGCESKCAYCIIPRARGPICSRPLEDCINEAKALVEGGYKEIVLTGIEVSAYGNDLEKADLAALLEGLNAIKGLERIRLSSIDPSFLRPAFTDRIAALSAVVPHFHLSLQSGCDGTLHRMRRRYNTEILKRNLGYLMDRLPGVRFTADVIVGFPGETAEEFEKTCAFLETLPLLHTHVFAYSPRPGTEAAEMKEQLPEQIKKERSAALIALCERIGKETLQKEIGKTYPVLFEQHKNGIAYGHTPNFIEVALPSKDPLDNLILPVSLRLLDPQTGVVYGERKNQHG